ncbi:AGAP002033-PA-like protein [Anopheles sinensis]|uniref:arginine kinase n=1 Tax=Anopheles sinensis TaxID=74873 RepID=A0A084VTW4_ANOSI|nr:AGAP002033-PA-like protein [Anopheles sinensis]
MASLEQKREAFRKYLESAGAIDCLSKALIRLYQEEQKPEDACKFIRQVLCESCPTDEQVAESMSELDEARKRILELEREIRGLRLNVRRTASEENLLLEDGFEKLARDESCTALLKKYLTREVLDELKSLKTQSYKSTLLDCIQSGLQNCDSNVGVYAADPEAYLVFAALMDPLIEEYHGGFGKEAKQPELSWGEPEELENPDPEGLYVVSTRVRCARSLENFPFHPRMQEQQYEDICARVKAALEDLPEDLTGELHLLEALDESRKCELEADHFLFQQDDRFAKAAQADRFYPAGRAVFLNGAKSFIVWVNEEDHLRIISMQKGSDIAQVYKRLIAGAESIGKHITFQRDERLGFLNFCPTNIGTGMRASMHVRLPKLQADRPRLESAAAEYRLQIRGENGENSDSCSDVVNVSNKRRIGLTEFEAVKEMVDGVKALIELEKQLSEVVESEPAAEGAEPPAEE